MTRGTLRVTALVFGLGSLALCFWNPYAAGATGFIAGVLGFIDTDGKDGRDDD